MTKRNQLKDVYWDSVGGQKRKRGKVKQRMQQTSSLFLFSNLSNRAGSEASSTNILELINKLSERADWLISA